MLPNKIIKFEDITLVNNEEEDGCPGAGIPAIKIVNWEYLIAKEYVGFYPVEKDWTIVSAGAWLGIESIFFSRLAQKVFALEPITDTFVKLLENCKLNNASNVYPINIGLGDQTGLLDMIITNNSAASGFENYDPSHNTLMEKRQFQIYTWDDFVDSQKLQKVDLCIVDIEGAEGRFLTKMTKCLPKRLMIAIYHPNSPISKWKHLISERGYVYDGIIHEYQGLDGKPGDTHSHVYHLEEKK